MRYWVRLFTALLLVGAAVATFGIAIAHLAETGSCSTGGTPDNLPDCPADTVWWILSIFGAVLSLLVGIGVFASKGSRGGTASSSGSASPAAAARPVTTYAPKPPPLPTTWPAGGDAKGEDEDEDPLDRLAKLGELKKAGVISDSEFELQKAKLLGDI